MANDKDISRRAALGAPAVMMLSAASAACGQGPKPTGARTLVAYFTRSGNTRVIAGSLQRELGATLFEIIPARPYPEDYEQNVGQAARETRSGFEPALKAKVPNLAPYDTVFLGFPIWGTTAPPIIRTFLHTHDLGGKTLRPFITHGGYGVGDSMSVVRSHAPRAQIVEPFVMEADQERRTLTQVRGWLADIK